MENNKKLKESLEKDIKYTSANYANMHDRLQIRDNISKFLIVYYSVIGIINSILPKYWVSFVDRTNIFDFSAVIISIILLVASLSVSLANYSERTIKAVVALDKLKRMKKEIVIYSEDDLIENDYKLFKELTQKYHDIVDNMELRSDFDYYKTCKNLNTDRERFTIGQCIKVCALHMIEIFIYFVLTLLPMAFYIYMFNLV